MATSTGYKVLRAVSATDDTGLAAGGAKYSDVSSSLVAITPSQRGMIHIYFKGTDAENENGNWVLYAVKGTDAPAEFVAYGTFTLGLTQTGETDEFYADTIVITVQNWIKTVSVVDGYQYNLGTGALNGGVAKLVFDSCEYEYLYMLMSKGTCATGGADMANFY